MTGATHAPIEVISRGIIRAGSSLLLCRNVKSGHLYLPGGHVEAGEGARVALERELREEAGISIRAGSLAFVAESSFRTDGSTMHEINLVFHVEHHALNGDDPVRSLEAHIEFIWVSSASLSGLRILPAVVKDRLIAMSGHADRARPADLAGIDKPLWVSDLE